MECQGLFETFVQTGSCRRIGGHEFGPQSAKRVLTAS